MVSVIVADRKIEIEGTLVNPELFVAVGYVPPEVAAVAREDAQADITQEDLTAQDGRDIAAIHTHMLDPEGDVRLSVAAYAIIGYVMVQGAEHEGWFRKPGNKTGILSAISQRIGGECEAARGALALCAAQDFLELKTDRKTNGIITINARTTERGAQVHAGLSDYYEPRLEWIDLSGQHGAIDSMVEEIGHMSEALGHSIPPELLALKNPSNIDNDNLPTIVNDLKKLMRFLEAAVDAELQEKREERQRLGR